MNCAEAREELSAALDGALTAEEAQAVEAHAASCAACRAWRAELADVRGLLRGIDDADEPPGLSASVGRGVLAVIEGRAPAPGSEDRRRFRRSAVARSVVRIAIAAVIGAVGVLAVFAVLADRLLRRAHPAKPGAISREGPGPSVSRPRLDPELHGHLDMSSDDESTREELRALFTKWPGTFTASQSDADQQLFTLSVEFEGPSGAAGDFEKLLTEFQRAHSGSLRSWRYSSQTRD